MIFTIFLVEKKCIWNIAKFYDILYAYLISCAEWIYCDAFLTYDLLFTSNHERKGREKIKLNSVNRGKKNCCYIALVQFGFSLSLNWYYFAGVTSFYRHVCRKLGMCIWTKKEYIVQISYLNWTLGCLQVYIFVNSKVTMSNNREGAF